MQKVNMNANVKFETPKKYVQIRNSERKNGTRSQGKQDYSTLTV